MLRLIAAACLVMFVLVAGLVSVRRGNGDSGGGVGTVAAGPKSAAEDLRVPAQVLDGSGTVLFDFGDDETGNHRSADAWLRQRVLDELLVMEELGATPDLRQARLIDGGLTVRLSIDPDLQEVARWAFDSRVPEGLDAALVTIDNDTGAVVAAVGHSGADVSRVLPAPVARVATYLAATELGWDVVNGTGPCTVEAEGQSFSTTNFGMSAGRETDLQSQVLASSRCALLRLEAEIGVGTVRDSITKLTGADTTGPVPPVIAPPELSALETATMYATIANGGIATRTSVVADVVDHDGDIVYVHSPLPEQVVQEGAAGQVQDMLRANVAMGTGMRAGTELPSEADVGGLTGTMEDFSAAWFAGWFENRTTALWVMLPGSEPMTNVSAFAAVTGGSLPAQAWGAYHAHQGKDPSDLEAAPSPAPTRQGERQASSSATELVADRIELTEMPAVIACPSLPAPEARHLGPGDGELYATAEEALLGALGAIAEVEPRVPPSGYVEGTLPDGTIVYLYEATDPSLALATIVISPAGDSWQVIDWAITAC